MYKATFESPIAILGFSCFLAMNSFSLWGFSFLPAIAFGPSAADCWTFPLAICNSLSFIVFAYLDKMRPVITQRIIFKGAVASLAIGAIFLIGFITTKLALPLIASACFIGIGTTCCFLCWMKSFSMADAPLAKFRLICGSVLSVAPYLLFPQTNQYALLCFVGILALVNLASLRFLLAIPIANMEPTLEKSKLGESKQGEQQHATSEPQSILQGTTLRRYRSSLLCVAMIGTVSPILQAACPFEEESLILEALMVHGSNVLAAATLAIVWFGLKRETTIKNTYGFIFPLLLTTFSLFPFTPSELQPLLLIVGSFGFSLFSIVMMTMCLDIAAKRNLRLIGVYSLFAAVTYTSRIVGQGVATIITSDPIPPDTQIILAAFVLLYCCSIVMFAIGRKTRLKARADVIEGNDVSATHAQPTTQIPAPDPLEHRCDEIARKYGLTPRQHEIMTLFAHGYDIPAIAKKLYISENTVRTHTKKLYLILNVHSKREIIELINKDDASIAPMQNGQ